MSSSVWIDVVCLVLCTLSIGDMAVFSAREIVLTIYIVNNLYFISKTGQLNRQIVLVKIAITAASLIAVIISAIRIGL